MTPSQAQSVADWEVVRAFGLSSTLTVTLPTWRQPSGALWDAGLRVPVDIEALNIRGDWVIDSVNWAVDDGGTITTLTLNLPESYKPQPEIPETATQGQGAGWAPVFSS